MTRDITGQRFGRLTVASLLGSVHGKRRWLCRCECGCEVVTSTGQLASGKTQSCGCLRREIAATRMAAGLVRATPKRGNASITHRAELLAWSDMNRRCSCPESASFARYGGRGITVCDRWRESFANFLADMGPRPFGGYSLDRIDNTRGYEPGNCRWATSTAQMRNTRKNLRVTIDGETLCVTEWCERSGLNPQVATYRLRRGWEPRLAVFTPAAPRRPSRSCPTGDLLREIMRRERQMDAEAARGAL